MSLASECTVKCILEIGSGRYRSVLSLALASVLVTVGNAFWIEHFTGGVDCGINYIRIGWYTSDKFQWRQESLTNLFYLREHQVVSAEQVHWAFLYSPMAADSSTYAREEFTRQFCFTISELNGTASRPGGDHSKHLGVLPGTRANHMRRWIRTSMLSGVAGLDR